jgi:hypothetical protein
MSQPAEPLVLGGARMHAEALSHAGVGVAGDTFDFRILDNLVSPVLVQRSEAEHISRPRNSW